jgi:uncharacterized membrane protein
VARRRAPHGVERSGRARVSSYDLALLLHLVAVISFFAGMAIAAAAQLASSRRERACEIAAVLGVARTGVLLVAAGTVLLLVSGLWLIEETGHSVGDGWLALSLVLLVAAVLLGAVGGRKPKQARLLAEQQADKEQFDPRIAALLRDRAANLLAAAAAFAILMLMVWRPS